MQHLLKPKQRNNQGFTFVEVVVIAPIVILAIGAFITAIVGMTADVLRSRGANELVYSVQDAINRIDEDVKLSIGFLAEDNVSAQTGQRYITTGPSTATFMTKFRNVGSTIGNVLIINALATTGNPLASTSSVAYLQNSPNACGNLQGQNTPLTYNILYYVANNALWRRVLMSPDYATVACNQNGSGTAAPWQQPSCTPGYTAYYAYCATDDEKLVDGISSSNFVITYYNSADATAANNTASDSGASVSVRNTALKSVGNVGVSINASKLIAGDTISQSSSLRSTRLDVNASTIADPIVVSTPSTPVVTGSHTAPVTASFSWPTSTGNGTITYSLDYCIGVTATCNSSGPWTNGLNNSTATSYPVPGTGHNQIVNVRVRATNSAGTSSYGTATITVPLWATPIIQNNWTTYDNTYSPVGYTKTSDGVVVLRGMVRSGSTTAYQPIFNLPAGYRPEATLIFGNTTDSNSWGRVDVRPNGDVLFVQGSNAWYSLDTIRFVPNGPYTRTGATFANSWTNYGTDSLTTYANSTTITDTNGRIWQQGLIKPGTYGDGVYMQTLPSSKAPSDYSLYSGLACSGGWAWYDLPSSSDGGGVRIRNINPGGCMSLQLMWYPNTFSGWTTLPLVNGWVRYNPVWTPPRYVKGSDGLVTLGGMISSGSTTYDTVIATLPSGFRPKYRLLMTTTNNSSHARIDVLPNGEIHFMGSSNAWYSLDPITFIAEQ